MNTPNTANAVNAPNATINPVSGTSRTVVWIAGTVALILSIASMQGMVAFGTDLMRLPLWVALAVCVVLELFAVAMGLLARDAVRAQRSHKADTMAMWSAAAVSGVLAAAHQVITPGHVDVAAWTVAPAAFRFALPLFAAMLWHRILVADMHAMDPAEPRAARRRRDAVRTYAAAALRARRQPGEATMAALDEAHETMLKIVPADDPSLAGEVEAYVASFAQVDAMPDRTLPQVPERAALPAAPADQVPQHAESAPMMPVVDDVEVTDLAQLVARVEDPADQVPQRAAVAPEVAADVPVSAAMVPPPAEEVPEDAGLFPAPTDFVPARDEQQREWTAREKLDFMIDLLAARAEHDLPQPTGREICDAAAAEGLYIPGDRAARHLRSKGEEALKARTRLHAVPAVATHA